MQDFGNIIHILAAACAATSSKEMMLLKHLAVPTTKRVVAAQKDTASKRHPQATHFHAEKQGSKALSTQHCTEAVAEPTVLQNEEPYASQKPQNQLRAQVAPHFNCMDKSQEPYAMQRQCSCMTRYAMLHLSRDKFNRSRGRLQFVNALGVSLELGSSAAFSRHPLAWSLQPPQPLQETTTLST